MNIYFLFILLLTVDIIHSTPEENNEIKVDEILGIQKCFDINKSNAKKKKKKLVIYKINNNLNPKNDQKTERDLRSCYTQDVVKDISCCVAYDGPNGSGICSGTRQGYCC